MEFLVKSLWVKLILLPSLCGILLLEGCSTPSSRRDESSAAFQKLSPRDQQLVMHGQIVMGMNEEAVFVAKGEASRKESMDFGGKQVVVWVYTVTQRLPVSDPVPVYDSKKDMWIDARNASFQRFGLGVADYDVDDLDVYFYNGKVIGWLQL